MWNVLLAVKFSHFSTIVWNVTVLSTLVDVAAGFDQLVKASKGKAEEALTKVPEIENMIEQAENKTTEAQDALSGAEADANMALQLAQQAQTIAQNASSVSEQQRCWLLGWINFKLMFNFPVTRRIWFSMCTDHFYCIC